MFFIVNFFGAGLAQPGDKYELFTTGEYFPAFKENPHDPTMSTRASCDGPARLSASHPEMLLMLKKVKRIRHYGVLASACKAKRLAQARAALAMPTSNPQAQESAAQFMCRIKALEIMRCPCCALGQLRLVQTVPAPDRLPAPSENAGARDSPSGYPLARPACRPVPNLPRAVKSRP
jgi:hypothetical protein